MSGPADVDHATISLPPKSCTGARYALPQGCLNSVTPVPVFCHGASAEKSRPMAFSKVSPATLFVASKMLTKGTAVGILDQIGTGRKPHVQR